MSRGRGDRGRDKEWSSYPEAKAFLAAAARDLPGKIGGSAMCISLVPDGEIDPKFAVELGYMIMLDRPIIAVVVPGATIGEKFAKVVDRFVELPANAAPAQLDRVLQAVIEELGTKGKP